MRIILVGSIGRFPVAGHAWINRQYLMGFRSLGHDVFYLEDCGDESWVYDWNRQELTTDLAYPASFVSRALDPIGLADRWCYRVGNQTAGQSLDVVYDVCRNADLMIVRGSPMPVWREEYARPATRAFIDVDPLFTQVKAVNGDKQMCETIARCETLFTIAQRMGDPDCLIPDLGRTWHKTVSPVYLPEWPACDVPTSRTCTTIMQWSSYKAVEFDGQQFGNKSWELPKFLEVGRRTDRASFSIAMTGRPPESVDTNGWEITSGEAISAEMNDYRSYIQDSFAEFSVAKHGYVASNSGWFSDRSACYLVSGRPVIVQSTGIESAMPTGEGVLTFRTVDDAVDAVHRVVADPKRHAHAARRFAEEHLACDRVLSPMLAALGE